MKEAIGIAVTVCVAVVGLTLFAYALPVILFLGLVSVFLGAGERTLKARKGR
mgnify:CR=1 FL=1